MRYTSPGPEGADRELQVRYECPAYTASLDAAMTLVPEGWLFDLYNLNGYPEAHLTNDTLQRVAVSVVTATPALALCAAALRAQEAHNG